MAGSFRQTLPNAKLLLHTHPSHKTSSRREFTLLQSMMDSHHRRRGLTWLLPLVLAMALGKMAAAATPVNYGPVPEGASPVAEGLYVHDGVFDDAGEGSREAVLQGFLDSMGLSARKRYGATALPGTLWAKVVGLIGGAPQAVAAAASSGEGVKVPAKVSTGKYGLHKDADPYRRPIHGRVGVVYLEGEGDLVFTHARTGEEHAVEVKAGRFISWDNDKYWHRLVPGPLNTPRRMLGPMSFQDLAQSLITAAYFSLDPCPLLTGYSCVDTPALTPAWDYKGEQFPMSTCAGKCLDGTSGTATTYELNLNEGPNGTCRCFLGSPACPGGYLPAAGAETSVNNPNPCPVLKLAAPIVPFSLQATGPAGAVASGGCPLVTARLSRMSSSPPAAFWAAHRELLGKAGGGSGATVYPAVPTKSKPGNATDYALRVTLPAGWSLKRASVRPAYKPTAAWKAPQQTTTDSGSGATALLWPAVPVPQYANGKTFTRAFKLALRTAKGTPAGSYPVLVEAFQTYEGVAYNQQAATVLVTVK